MVPLYQSYLNTQVGLVLSPPVLQNVLELPEVKQTQWFKVSEKTWFGPSPSQVDRLRRVLLVQPRPGTEFIDVSVAIRSPSEAATIVNAVVDEYLKYITEKSSETQDQIYNRLVAMAESLKQKIDGTNQHINEFKRRVATADPNALWDRQKQEHDK